MENLNKENLKKEDDSMLKVEEFIVEAAKCQFNHIWICMHHDTVGKPCTKLCKNFYKYKE